MIARKSRPVWWAWTFSVSCVASLGLAGCAISSGARVASSERARVRTVYPPAARQDVKDVYHGVEVADPYRWLEDSESAQTKAWIQAQNAVTQAYLSRIPRRASIEARMMELINFERFTTPTKEGGRYFYSRNSGQQNQNVLYVADGLEQEPRVLLDPNTFSEDGTVSLSQWSVSRDGKRIAYGRSDGGSDWVSITVRDIDSGQESPEALKWIKFASPSWSADGAGFWYSRFPTPEPGAELQAKNENMKVYYHTVGTPQDQDKLVYERPDNPRWNPYAGLTDDGKFLVLHIAEGFESNALFYRDLSSAESPVVELFSAWDARYEFVGNEGSTFFIRTNKDAPLWRVVAVDVEQGLASMRDVIPQAAESLDGVTYVGGRLIASYLKDAKSVIRSFSPGGEDLGEVALPGVGTAGGFFGKANDPETFYSFTGFTSPTTFYRLDVSTGESSVFRQPAVDFDPSLYESKQVFYTSKDGTRVPMFIVHKKGLRLDGSNPTLLYGYGGFDVSLTPSFSTGRVAWMEMGGVYAMANIRGGGEYGREWHESGTRLKKQNVFDDFIAAAEYLIDRGYTRADKLAIEGGSNGGLLVAACAVQRPELYGAVLCHVGVLDMLRYHTFTIGKAWSTDYGTSEDPAEFQALLAYSPYHNVKPGVEYPPMLITTGEHDDRVVPAHSFKFAAAIQHAQAGTNPTIIRIETRAGHGAGTPLRMAIEHRADEFAFLARELGMSIEAPRQ